MAIFTGGPLRVEMTCKSLNSINLQSFSDIQKLLINFGRSKKELEQLRALGALTSDWDIIQFPIPIFSAQLLEASYCIGVKAAISFSKGKYFFGMNDDDFLATDFFERMNILFKKYPSAISGIGLMNRYFHHDSRVVSPPINSNNREDWRTRPEFESGMNVFHQIYGGNNYAYNPNPGFAYVCRLDKIKEVESTYLYGAGYPDNSCLIQIVSRGQTVFDRSANMYWGRHEKQEHLNYDLRHYWDCFYKTHFESIVKINLEFMKKFHPGLNRERKMIKKYFRIILTDSSINSLMKHLKKEVTFETSEKLLNEIDLKYYKFPLIRHLLIVLTNPIYTVRRFVRKIRNLKLPGDTSFI